jgi:hypothetical protein
MNFPILAARDFRAERRIPMGTRQNSHRCARAHPPANSAGPRPRPGLTEVLVTGMLIRWISVSTPRTGRARDVLGHRAALFERGALRLPPSGGIEGIVVEGAKLMRVERTRERQHL